jgi:hypothetical protein
VSEPGRLSDRTLDLLVVVLAIGALIAFWAIGDGPHPLGFPLDDAWIHMVYGRNLAQSGLLAFNEGVAATGSTSPLWAGLVAIAHSLGGGDVERIVTYVLVLGAACHVLAVLLVSRVIRALTVDSYAAAIGGALVAVSGPMLMGAYSGMEVSLAAALLLAAVLSVLRSAWLPAGLYLAFAALARPETVAVSLVCFAFVAWTTHTTAPRERTGALARLTLPSLVLGGGLVAYALWATGRMLPATFYMKQERNLGELPARLATAFTGLIGDVPPFQTGLVALALVGFVFAWRRVPALRGAFVLVVAAPLAFVLANVVLIQPRPNVFYHLRYLLPAIPLLVAAVVVGACELGRSDALASRRLRYVPLVLVGLFGITQGAVTLKSDSTRLHNDTRNIEEVQRKLGGWIGEHTLPGTWIATGDAGAVKYFGRRPTIDVMGLNTPELYWQPGWAQLHSIAAFVMLPCWFHPVDPSVARIATTAQTENYTVTTLGCMFEQYVVTCAGSRLTPLAFAGVKSFELSCQPGALVTTSSPKSPK